MQSRPTSDAAVSCINAHIRSIRFPAVHCSSMLPQWGPLRTKSYQGRGGSSAVAATDRAICVAKPINTRTACSCRAARYGLTTTGTGAGWVGSKMLSSVLGGAIAVHLLLPFSSVAALSPYEEAKQLVYGPTADGRVRACPSNVNPNCVSTGGCRYHGQPQAHQVYKPSANPAHLHCEHSRQPHANHLRTLKSHVHTHLSVQL